ncbi:RagB/SusD family nutrient uptake outer membrane protein [Chitinophaga sp. NPDC101104]|uniref:RagB/SusD family nutrient uptake outer membrane protein n=1 Tax=Chitinophaga sp. NPDC101104 TaxID=3390561 RepID=UPI003D054FA2
MNKIFRYGCMTAFAVMLATSCNTEKFLKEEPLDFYTPGNALNTAADFQSATNYLHNRMRHILFGGINLDANFSLRYATDFAVNATDYNPPVKLNDYKNTMVPTFNVVEVIWQNVYTVISNANVIISRVPKAAALSEADRNSFKAQALFFRAWGYNMLANLYGGVPLITEEVTMPRTDYVRATRDEVYNLCRKDLTEALLYLKDIDAVKDGAVNKQAAYHLLTEVLISLKAYDDAINAATQVINHPALSLMTQRFGRRAAKPGDVYRDLFELNNQNRSSGNKEGIFVIQTDYLNPASPARDVIQWAIMPNLTNLRVMTSVNGAPPSSQPAVLAFNDQLAGRGIGWIRPTKYFLYDIWTDPNDIRNSEYNIVRDFIMDGVPKNSDAYGKWYVKDGFKARAANFADTIRSWYPVLKKATFSEGDFPIEVIQKDANGNPLKSPFAGQLLFNSSGDVYSKDAYLMRLAETYLLRAEAYIRKGDKPKAAEDINKIRARANAAPVAESDVTIDYLLDERLRELYVEELRMVTLCRMGLLYDRDKKYNEKSGLTIQPYHNLWPIPFSEIERNTGAVITQNPEYK